MSIAQRQDIILLPTGKREGKKKEEERPRERKSKETVSFWVPCHLIHTCTAKGTLCARGMTLKRRGILGAVLKA